MYLAYHSIEYDRALSWLKNNVIGNEKAKFIDIIAKDSWEDLLALNFKAKYYVVPNAHILLQKSDSYIKEKLFLQKIFKTVKEANVTIIFIMPPGVEITPELADMIWHERIPLPDYDEIKKKFKVKNPKYFLGLTESQIDYILRLKKNPKKYQAKIFAEDGFSLKDPKRSFDTIFGIDEIKNYFKERKLLLEDPKVSFKGILLVGKPGTGKSVTAEAIADYLDVPFIEWNVGKLMSSYYGETERRIASALERLNALPAAVLKIDEIDKMLSGIESSTVVDAGTTARWQGVLQSWLAEQNRIFVVGTTNKISRIDAPLIRKGRFNKVFYVRLPDKETRKQIAKYYLNKFEICLENLDEFAEKTDRMTGADIEFIVEEYYIKLKNYGNYDINSIIEEVRKDMI